MQIYKSLIVGIAGALVAAGLWLGFQSMFNDQSTMPADANKNGLQTEAEIRTRFVGSNQCKDCHQGEYKLWLESDHALAMQQPNEESVLGDFNNTSVEFHGYGSRFFTQDDQYYIEITDHQAVSKTYQVKFTFGHYPLQQYLLEIDGGRLQAYDVAWDSRDQGEGGQRWFHLQPDEAIDEQHPFFWTKHFQNWNSRCSDCHSTNVSRGYDQNTNQFQTSFSEVNVACEACHGAGSQHVRLAEAGSLENDSGFQIKKSKPLEWRFSDTKPIAKGLGKRNQDDINMCGRCHSLRAQLSAHVAGEDFHDLNRVQLSNEVSYFADGQIKEEAFVLGSFLQSKMHHKGVTCSNCHQPHSGKVLVEGNGLCGQCHLSTEYDSPEHHHHNPAEAGSLCVNCHMPDRAFMQVDHRRDHSFTTPRPDLSIELGVPNACTQCHQDHDDLWAKKEVASWDTNSESVDQKRHWSRLVRRASENDVLVTRAAVQSVMNTGLPDFLRASLLEHLAPIPSRVSAEAARKSLFDKSPMLRRAAVVALQSQPFEVRWQHLSAMIKDQSKSVRMQIANALLDGYRQLPAQEQARLAPLYAEYRASLAISADSVTTQLSIANMEMALGDLEAAEQAFKAALIIEPSFVPALLSVAEFYRRSARSDDAFNALSRAIEVAPDSASAQHSIGLHYVRQKQYSQAIKHLKAATEQNDAAPYYAYVYAVALENQNKLSEAIAVLEKADQRWANQYEILLTLVLYYEKAGQADRVLPALSKLSAIAPAAPAVKNLIDRYKSG